MNTDKDTSKRGFIGVHPCSSVAGKVVLAADERRLTPIGICFDPRLSAFIGG
jgi:hypothetical protein